MRENPVTSYGNLCWYNEDEQLHRTDGPAIIWADGTQEWWINGRRHREDGPAIIYHTGTQYWIINGIVYYHHQSFQKAAKISNEDMTAIVLKYGNVK